MFRLILATLVALAGPVSADTPLDKMVENERRAMNGLPDSRLVSFLQRPARQIEYSGDWLAAQSVTSGGPAWRCPAEQLSFEARGETVKGQFAVAEVILNRVDSVEFPDDVCAVVRQGTGRKYQCQFSYTCDGHKEVIAEPGAFERAGKIARLMLQGAPRALTEGATYFHARAVSPNWARRFERTAAIGSHLFYRKPTRLSAN